jgi:methylthioribose-1-phosphate isomerase
VLEITGRDDYGQTQKVGIAPHGARAVNFAFDVTPARLVTGLVTERGVTRASKEWIEAMFPERAGAQ